MGNSTSGPGDFGEVKYDKYVFDKNDMRDLFNADQNFLKLEKPCLNEYQNRLMHNKHAIFKSIFVLRKLVGHESAWTLPNPESTSGLRNLASKLQEKRPE